MGWNAIIFTDFTVLAVGWIIEDRVQLYNSLHLTMKNAIL